MFRDFAASYQNGLQRCFEELSVEELERIAEVLLRAQEEGRKVFVLGNGGSASTASHMAVDLGKGTAHPGRPRLRVISLADNMGLITAWANDTCYEVVFQEQLENLLEPGDVVIGISASGNSPNVLRAMEYARQRNAITVGFIGFGGGKLRELVQMEITVSSKNYGQVEDFHLSLNHILSQYLKERIQAQAMRKAITGRNGAGLSFFFRQPPNDGVRPAVLFDRDGVINERVFGGYVTEWQQFRFVEGIRESLANLAELDLPIIVVSNQAVIGKGLLSESALQRITERFVAELKGAGARIDAVYYCPHTAEQGCGCRKPRVGLLEEAAQDWRVDLARSVLIGDTQSDLEAARALRCKAILLAPRTGSEEASDPTKGTAPGTIMIQKASEIATRVRQLLEQVVPAQGPRAG